MGFLQSSSRAKISFSRKGTSDKQECSGTDMEDLPTELMPLDVKSFFYIDGDGMKHAFDDSDASTTAGSPLSTLESLPSFQMWDGDDRDEDEDSQCDDESQIGREEDLPFVSELPTRLEPSDARGLLWESSRSKSTIVSV